MVVTLAQFGVAYFPVPKVACSSLKDSCFALEHGKPFVREENGGVDIHHIYPTVAVTRPVLRALSGLWRFALVRDPVQRLLSAYANRVVHYREPQVLSQGTLSQGGPLLRVAMAVIGLDRSPGPDSFFSRLGSYRALMRSIRHHTDDQRVFLGPSLDHLDAVYRLEEIDRLAEDLGARTTGTKLTLARRQTGGPKIAFASLSDATKEKLIELTKRDYAFLGGLYSPPTA